jgi:hypothetical protein
VGPEGRVAGEAAEHVIAKAVEETGVRESTTLVTGTARAAVHDTEQTAARDALRHEETATAETAAEDALRDGKRRGAASDLRLPGDEKPYVDVSGSPRVHHPDMVAALDSVPEEIRPGFHGWCSEIGAMNQGLHDGRTLQGGSMRTVAIGKTPPGHQQTKAACPTCSHVMKAFGVIEDAG